MVSSSGPLEGVRVIEFAGIGPAPHACMLLADMGAHVVRIEREGGGDWPNSVQERGRAETITLDIRTNPGRDECLRLIHHADVVVEGFRPGVMERLGLGPEVALMRNERLIYGRMTGWGQTGPLAQRAGHDLNYIGLSGVLAEMGSGDSPPPVPLNLIGDFGGGSMFLVAGITAALFERSRSNKGQVIDAAIVDGVANLMSFFTGVREDGNFEMGRGKNLLAGNVPFYRCYRCRDGRFMSVASLEPKFFSELIRAMELNDLADGQTRDRWPALEKALEEKFLEQDQAYWSEIFETLDACVFPVLDVDAAMQHPHLVARQTWRHSNSRLQPALAPRFASR